MRRPVPVLLVACAFGVQLLAACGGGSTGVGGPAATTTPVASSPAAAEPANSNGATSDAASATAPAAGHLTRIKVEKSASSADYGDKWTVHQVVRSFPVPARLPAIQGSEIVLVRITATAGKKYYSSFGESSFRLIGDDATENAAMGQVVSVEMAAAGNKPMLPDVTQGKSGDGWLAFRLDNAGSKTLTLRYKQNPASVVGGGSVKAKDIDIKLVG